MARIERRCCGRSVRSRSRRTGGPSALGEYAVILFAALAGALWPLSGRDGITRTDGALLVSALCARPSRSPARWPGGCIGGGPTCRRP